MAGITSGDAIRAAICGLLDSSRGIAAVLRNRVAFRDVGAFTTFPFLAIGHTRERKRPQAHIEEHIVTVHLWLKPGENEAAQDLMRSIRRAFDRGPLRIQGARIVSFRFDTSGLRLAPELESLHATLRYRLRLSRVRRLADETAVGCPNDGTNAA